MPSLGGKKNFLPPKKTDWNFAKKKLKKKNRLGGGPLLAAQTPKRFFPEGGEFFTGGGLGGDLQKKIFRGGPRRKKSVFLGGKNFLKGASFPYGHYSY